MIKKLFITLTILFLPLSIFAFSGNGKGTVSTPNATRASFKNLPSQLKTLFQRLDALSKDNYVNCNTSLTTNAHALICNCANEVFHPASVPEKAKVTKVVFSRIQHPNHTRYGHNAKTVICKPSQFSWTMGNFDRNCNRLHTKCPHKNFKNCSLSGDDLKACVNSIKLAAKEKLVDRPNDLYALNYLNPGASTDRSWLNSCRRTLVEPKSGHHLFCNPERIARGGYQPIATEAIAVVIPLRYEH